VLPELVSQLPKKTEQQIYREVMDLPRVGEWVVFTGGNPALLELDHLIDLFHNSDWKIMLETQGSVFRKWFRKIDDLCFSPKPPSAGNTTDLPTLKRIIDATVSAQAEWNRGTARWFMLPYLKVPVFTEQDMEYAAEVHNQFPDLGMFISIGNDTPSLPTVGNPEPYTSPMPLEEIREEILANFKDILAIIFSQYPELQDCQIFPQQHVLLWGNERGH